VSNSQKEKEDQIQKLLNDGHTSRYITKNARCSPNEVSRIRKEKAGEELDKMKTLPITTQAFKLFLENKILVEVASF
jgi:ureidoglycolate hydrolase